MPKSKNKVRSEVERLAYLHELQEILNEDRKIHPPIKCAVRECHTFAGVWWDATGTPVPKGWICSEHSAAEAAA